MKLRTLSPCATILALLTASVAIGQGCSSETDEPATTLPGVGGTGATGGGALGGTGGTAGGHGGAGATGGTAGSGGVPDECEDGVLNGDESDVDCGGAACDPCAVGDDCRDYADCETRHCVELVCTACALDTDCSDTVDSWCDAPNCVPLGLDGVGCEADNECLHGHCADAVCCESACDAACDVCDVVGSEGSCLPAPDGDAGDGSCLTYLCDGTSTVCPTSCVDLSDCSDDAYCDANDECVGTLTLGSACQGGSQCESDHCVDGVCCADADCPGECARCDLSGDGSCSNSPTHVTCGSGVAEPTCNPDHCATDGTCTDENPAAADTACTDNGGSVCDGAGHCVECNDDDDCGTTDECVTFTCTNHECSQSNTAAGPTPTQTTGDCQESRCDGAGHTVSVDLDTDLPADDGNECTDEVCSAGVPEHPNHLDTVTCNGGTDWCDGSGHCVECNLPEHCGPTTACLIVDCTNHVCGSTNAPGTTPCGDALSQPTCNPDHCDAGYCVNVPPVTQGTGCADGGGSVCDADGHCVECNVADDCGPSTECRTYSCLNETCDVDYTTQGTAISSQTPEDCQVVQCDGDGGTESVADDGDVPIDDIDCTDDLCTDGVPSNPPATIGTLCNDDGGAVCDADGHCVECNDGGDCVSGVCAAEVCQPPVVTATVPAEGATNVSVGTPIEITFSGEMDPATLTAQTTTGACTGSIQLSTTAFASCVSFAAASPTMNGANTVATLVPAPALSYGTPYQIRVTTAAQDAEGTALAAAYTGTFTTGIQLGACAGSVVISQIYGGGGNLDALYTHDFVELHNRGNTPVVLDGWSLQYAAATGTFVNKLLLTGTIAPGGYFLVQHAGGSIGSPLPTPDQIGTASMSANTGKVALTSSTATLTGSGCPFDAAVVDFVGYGPNADCYEGSGRAGQPGNTTAVMRNGAGCDDTDDNAADFTVVAPAPRNGATTALICACGIPETVNETGYAQELDYCETWLPESLDVTAGQLTGLVYGRVYEAGYTEAGGANASIVAELGWGPAHVNPSSEAGFTYVPALFNAQYGSDDEYMAEFTAPASGSYRYVYRFSRDGSSWTYCDLNGSGSNADLWFEVHELAPLTVP